VVVHELAQRFVLRLGDEVVDCGRRVRHGRVPPKDGTTVSGVKRVLRSRGMSNDTTRIQSSRMAHSRSRRGENGNARDARTPPVADRGMPDLGSCEVVAHGG